MLKSAAERAKPVASLLEVTAWVVVVLGVLVTIVMMASYECQPRALQCDATPTRLFIGLVGVLVTALYAVGVFWLSFMLRLTAEIAEAVRRDSAT